VLKFFLYHQQKGVFLYWEIPLFITVKILSAIPGGVHAGEMGKVKPFCKKFLPTRTRFTHRIQFGQYTPVFSQGMIGVANITGDITVQAVVKSVPALIGAESFVYATNHEVSAFLAVLFNMK